MKIWKGNKVVAQASGKDAGKLFSSFKKSSGKDPAKQPSGKQPDPYTGGLLTHGHANTGKQPDPYTGGLLTHGHANTGKQPDTSALNAFDPDTLRRLQEAADRKRMEEQFEAAATHGSEYVFEFSKPLTSKVNTYVSKFVKLIGGKRSYIEDQTKLVVVM